MELDRVKNWYDNALKEYGIDSRSVGWNSKDSQNLRFLKLLEVVYGKEYASGGGGKKF